MRKTSDRPVAEVAILKRAAQNLRRAIRFYEQCGPYDAAYLMAREAHEQLRALVIEDLRYMTEQQFDAAMAVMITEEETA